MIKAIELWKDLESLTMPSIVNSPRLVQAIATNCRKFSELKIMGPFDIYFASSLVTYLPTLKVLSLRCSMLSKDTLIFVLDNLCCLEVLNISHCLLIEVPPPPAPRRIVRQLDKTILEKTSHLHNFLACMSDTCIMCQNTTNDEGLMRWYKYDEGLWKEDEVSSLALWFEHFKTRPNYSGLQVPPLYVHVSFFLVILSLHARNRRRQCWRKQLRAFCLFYVSCGDKMPNSGWLWRGWRFAVTADKCIYIHDKLHFF